MAEDPVGDQVGHFMRDGLGEELRRVGQQQGQIVAQLDPATRRNTHLAGSSPAQVEANGRTRDPAGEALLGVSQQLLTLGQRALAQLRVGVARHWFD